MNGPPRDWKTFPDRWNRSGRLEKYLGWSVVAHLLLLLFIGLSASFFYAEQLEERDRAEQQRVAEEEKEKEQIVEQARQLARADLKEELAREQLKTLFRELTEAHLTPEMAEPYWDELQVELEPELAGLAELLEGEDFDLPAAEQRVQEIKEKLVDRLAGLVARDRARPLREEAAARIAEQARQLAAFYRGELAEKAGRPAGEQLRQLAEAAVRGSADRLQKAEKELGLALDAAVKAQSTLDRIVPRLIDQQRTLAGATARKDNRGQAQSKAQTRRERAGLLGAVKSLTGARAALKKATDHLSGISAEKTLERLKTAAEGAARAAEKTQAAARAAGESKPADAAGKTKDAQEELRATVAALKQARSNLQRRKQEGGAQDRAALLRELDGLRQGRLARHADEQFQRLVQARVLPAVLKKADQVVNRQLKGKEAATAKAALQKEIEKALGKDLPGRVKAGEQVARGAGERLPRPGKEMAGPATPGPRALAAMDRVLPALDRNLEAVVVSGLRRLPALGGQGEKDARRGALLARLEALKNQIAVGRKDFLGRADGTALAAGQARHRDVGQRLASMGSGVGLRMDLEAYRKVAETMRERGRVAGSPFERQGARGDTSRGEDDRSLRPALVRFPDNPKPPPAPKPTDRKVAPPSFPTNRFVGAPFVADDAITIDGDLADWKDLPSLDLLPVPFAGPKPIVSPERQRGWLAYCPRGILLAVEVVDTTGKLEDHYPVKSFWSNDGVEVYLDTLNAKYSNRGEISTHQFFAFPLGQKDDRETGGYESRFSLDDRQKLDWSFVSHPRQAMPRAGKPTADGKGWTMELLIPRALLRQGEIQPGRIIGFNLQVDTGSGLYYFWSNPIRGRISMKPNTWGDVQLLGSDARIELLGTDGKETLRALIPGQSFRVRVTDPDMNLDDRKKDRVSVSVRSAGGVETLILEETAERTGVFVGAVPTRLNIGKGRPGLLEVFEGETITVEYLDQARAYGERDVPIKATFPVGSIGMKLADR
jgi:hypothetical protein